MGAQSPVRGRKEAIQNHKSAESSAEARKWRKEAEARIDEHREKFDDILRGEFQDAGFDNITVDELRDWSPFHWPLEFAGVFEEGGFDVFIGESTVGYALRKPG